MTGKRILIVSVLALALIGIFLVSPNWAAVGVGDKAPDFQLGSVDGKSTIKLTDYTSKPTVLVFWVSWCPHCRTELPVMQKIYTDLQSKGLNVVGVTADQSAKDAMSAMTSSNVTFPVALGGTKEGQAVFNNYGIKGVPAVYVIDKDGTIKNVHSGEVDEATIKNEVANLGIK